MDQDIGIIRANVFVEIDRLKATIDLFESGECSFDTLAKRAEAIIQVNDDLKQVTGG